jgi:hypothetical protein
MYNPEEDIIPAELLAQALALSNVSLVYRVYFDKDTGNLLSITNEENLTYTNFVEFEYDTVREFLVEKKQLSKYKIIFIDQNTPKIVSIYEESSTGIFLTKVPVVDNWDNMFTIENYPLLQKWGFQIRPDQKQSLLKYNLNTSLEIYIVDNSSMNFIYRTIKLSVNDLINKDRELVDYHLDKEGDINNISVYVKQFFSTVGYQILYDTNS